MILGIFEDPKKPTEMLETYTLSIEYPSSASHQVLWASSSQKVDMKLSAFSRKDASWCDRKISGGCESSFQKEMAGLIRSLCVLTQTLGPLPGTPALCRP